MFLAAGAMAAATAGRSAYAQTPGKVPRIGFLGQTSPASYAPFVDAFRQGLRDYGYIENRTIQIEFRWAEGNNDRLGELIAELVRSQVDIIVTHGTVAGTAAKRANTSIPIVVAGVGDFVGAGIVGNLARPEANITGLSLLATEISEKRMQLLRETLPKLARVALIWNPDNASVALKFKSAQAAALSMGMDVVALEIRNLSDLEVALPAAARAAADAIFLADDPVLLTHRAVLASTALGLRLPLVSEFRAIAEAGALWSYGPAVLAVYRRIGVYVDKLLKGAKPGDLPVEQPTQFELVINLKTASALGLAVPPQLLARADEVIE
jgi:putative tryptophan/tyrosine transport system substrate-binding protein